MTNLEQKNPVVKHLNELTPAQLVEDSRVVKKFITLYNTLHGTKSGPVFYEAEKFHFLKQLEEKQDLKQCSRLSLYGCFLDVAVNGLSFDPTMKHVYVVAYNHNVGTKTDPKWEKRAQLQISGYGELALRKKYGQIKYADNPVLVFEGDTFKTGIRDGFPFVEHEAVFPRKSENIIACYLRITRNDDTVDYKVLSMDEIQRIRKFSKDPNSKAWTDGLPGMVQAKTIKHAFRSYPKVRTGEFSKFDSEVIDEEVTETPVIDYTLEEKPVPTHAAAETPVEESPEVKAAKIQMTQKEESNGNGVTHDHDSF